MITSGVLAIAALVQAGILALGIGLLSLFHVLAGRRERASAAARERLEPRLLAWLGAPDDAPNGTLARLVAELRRTPAPLALHFVATAAAARLSPARRATLGRALRAEPWVARVLEGLASRQWWERLAAARLLAVVVAPADVRRIRALLSDPAAAVRLAAADVIPPLLGVGVPNASPPDEALAVVDALLDALPTHRRLVGAYHIDVLSRLGPQAARRVVARIDALRARRASESGRELVVWIDVADALGDQVLLERVRGLARHPDVEVRIHVARALRRLYSDRGLEALGRLLADGDWRVRAQAARSLGALGARESVPALAAAVGDAAWWVRYRAALGLAQLGEPGRVALRALRSGPDRMARDMSTLVSGLPFGMVAELGEG